MGEGNNSNKWEGGGALSREWGAGERLGSNSRRGSLCPLDHSVGQQACSLQRLPGCCCPHELQRRGGLREDVLFVELAVGQRLREKLRPVVLGMLLRESKYKCMARRI